MANQERPSTARQEPVGADITGETERKAGGTEAAVSVRTGSDRPVQRGDLRRALSSRRALREAILLHEILGTPKGMERSER